MCHAGSLTTADSAMPGSGWDRGGSDERPGPVSRHRSLPVPTLGTDQIVTLPIFGVGLAERPARPSCPRPTAGSALPPPPDTRADMSGQHSDNMSAHLNHTYSKTDSTITIGAFMRPAVRRAFAADVTSLRTVTHHSAQRSVSRLAPSEISPRNNSRTASLIPTSSSSTNSLTMISSA